MTGPVHFIWLGGSWCWQYRRAIETAQQVHGSPVWLWQGAEIHFPATTIPSTIGGSTPDRLVLRPLDLPAWLRHHPIKLANVKDLFAYRILHEHGGIYLDLDTISLRPAWDLLTADVCMSTEFPDGQEAGAKHNTAVLLARQGAPVMLELAIKANALLQRREPTWGAIGPHLISAIAELQPEDFSPAPFPALSGWSYHGIGNYYNRPRDPGEDTRVIHLYSSDNLDSFLTDKWTPTT